MVDNPLPPDPNLPPPPPGPAATSQSEEVKKLVESGKAPNQNSKQYLSDKAAAMSPEGLVNALKGGKDPDLELENYSLAIVVHELHELKEGLKIVGTLTALLFIVVAGGIIILQKGKPTTVPLPKGGLSA